MPSTTYRNSTNPTTSSNPSSSSTISIHTILTYIRTVRFRIAFLMFFAMFISYSLRAILSITILPITEQYQYTNTEKGYISSGFFIGYILFQFPTGILLSLDIPLRYKYYINGYNFLFLSICLPSFATIITPFLANNALHFLLIRILTGLFEGMFYSTIHNLTGIWFPYQERSTIIGSVWSGAYIGTCIPLYFSGIIINTYHWETVYYIFGTMGIILSIIWYIYASPYPEIHKYITIEEKNYIQRYRQGQQSSNLSLETSTNNTDTSTLSFYTILRQNIYQLPWKIIFSKKSIWSIIIQHSTHNFIFYMLLTWLPSYLQQLLQISSTPNNPNPTDTTSNNTMNDISFYTFVPYFTCFITSIASGIIADDLIKHQILSIITVRKLMQCIAEIIPAICLILISFIEYKPLLLYLFTIAIGCLGFNGGGYSCNHMDLSPKYSSLLMGLGNTFATLPGIIAPIFVGTIVGKYTYDWQIIFIITSIITILGYIYYYFYAEGTPIIELEGEQTYTNEEISIENNDDNTNVDHDNVDIDIDDNDDEGNEADIDDTTVNIRNSNIEENKYLLKNNTKYRDKITK